ncbi:rhomboid family intramembrane serine protease [Streptomyces sulfonofaciens]|uniref:Rhomboid family intramembrane serine protease n=1 Tax=Streptomyces sulfonofaciens TaxID=68272 RepID=A0A919FQ11_9ACTN|nr:rhomboid family intramembrane serine protease [Streptomyces sulfonofaciens]GHH70340.1 rhomboid family intramembrane serine protease [Streptomyces sulfonofaciens]
MGQADQAPDTPPPGDRQGAGGAGSAPTCYRHPDRETGVRCSRCDRPICPECMVSAAVGFQCPACVSSGSGTGHGPAAGRPRTIAGGAVASDPHLITKILIGINIAVFIAISLDDSLVDRLVLIGSWPPRSVFPPGVPYHATEGLAAGQWYRLVTSMFAHQEIWHIGFNMLSLWWLGGPLEAALGRARYLALYLVAGLAGGVLTYLLASPTEASLGASGAIYGLFGATAVLVRRLRYDMRPVIALLVINLIFTFSMSGIAWQAHIGGLVAGVPLAYAMVHAPRARRALVQWGACAVVLLVEVVVLVVRTVSLT